MKREKMALQKNIFGQKPGPAKTISDKKSGPATRPTRSLTTALNAPQNMPIWIPYGLPVTGYFGP